MTATDEMCQMLKNSSFETPRFNSRSRLYTLEV